MVQKINLFVIASIAILLISSVSAEPTDSRIYDDAVQGLNNLSESISPTSPELIKTFIIFLFIGLIFNKEFREILKHTGLKW